MTMSCKFLSYIFLVALASGQDGFVKQKSKHSVQQTMKNLVALLDDIDPITVALELDHSAAAKEVSMKLAPEKEVFFGNPNLGTLLMQEKQCSSLELPLRVLSWEDSDGTVFIGYNDPLSFIGSRHSLSETTSTLELMSATLEDLTSQAAGHKDSSNIVRIGSFMAHHDGVITKESKFNVADTIKNFETAIDGKIENFLRVDHAKSAKNVGLELRDTEVLVFGSAELGTYLMQSAPEVGIDLPLRAAAWEDGDGKFWLSYNDINYLADRYGITDQKDAVEAIETALENFSNEATGAVDNSLAQLDDETASSHTTVVVALMFAVVAIVVALYFYYRNKKRRDYIRLSDSSVANYRSIEVA